MELVVLGSSASYATAGRACAGYLVVAGETKLLLDCGHGALANLTGVADPLSLDAVVVSHAHPDHIVDLYALQARLRYAPDGPAPPLPLYAPAGLLERMGRLLSESGAAELREAFVSTDLEPGREYEIGSIVLSPFRAEHGTDAFGLTLQAGGASLCYSGDSAASEGLIAAARGSDTLLAEATLPVEYAGRAPHMSAREAAMVASEAAVGRLVVTHLWPTIDRDAVLEEVAREYDGAASVAEEMMRIDVSGPSAREGSDDAA
jgi:ribonuclease BN (tRNA processing enzyme)